MLRQPIPLAVLLLATITVAALPSAASGQARTKRTKKHVVTQQVVTTPPPPAPEPPKTPAQLPPVPPKVTYTNGLLSIDAPNSSLSDVLSAVRRATGANIEGGGSERIVAHLGPGKPRDVLSSLLQGSRYDFIILGPKGGDSSAVQRVMLMARSGGAASPTEAAPQPQPAPGQPNSQPMPQAANTNPGDDDESADQDQEQIISPKGQMIPEPEGPPSQPVPEENAPGGQPNAAQPQQQQNPGADQQQQQGPQVKTPEQLFKELQQLQQQRQQPQNQH